nr:hypothetical protein [Tanacetum cinerariifolium]
MEKEKDVGCFTVFKRSDVGRIRNKDGVDRKNVDHWLTMASLKHGFKRHVMAASRINHVFFPGDDPIACLNKAMAFLTVVASSKFLSTNNQLRTSSNLRNQATIQDGRVTVQQVQETRLKLFRDLLNEIIEVQTVFDQMNAAVQQSSVDKQCLEIAKKELLLENNRLLQQIMSQDFLLTVMNFMSLIGDTMNKDGNRKESCNLEAELLKSQNVFNDLLKNNEDLKAQIQDKVFVITLLKDDLRRIKGKKIVDIAAKKPYANTIVPGMFKLDLEPLVPRDTCPNAINLSAKKVAVTPKNKVQKVRFAEPLTSSSNIKQVESSNTTYSNTPMLSPTRLKCSTSNCSSKPLGNKKNDRISQTPNRNMKNKVEAQPRNVNKKNRVFEPIRNVDVTQSQLNVNSELICATCKKYMFDGVHD